MPPHLWCRQLPPDTTSLLDIALRHLAGGFHQLEGAKASQRSVHQEHFDREVGLDMRLAEEGQDLPAVLALIGPRP